eukprot:1266302-Pleurochrysis_carterae.AAC.1
MATEAAAPASSDRPDMYTRRSCVTRALESASHPKKAPSRCHGSAEPTGSHAFEEPCAPSAWGRGT